MYQNLSQHQRLDLRLSPQQVLYLKLLQLPVMSLEQRIKEELEINPMLEEGEETEAETSQEDAASTAETPPENESQPEVEIQSSRKDDYSLEDFINDDFDGYKTHTASSDEDDDRDEYPMPADSTLTQRVIDQLLFLNLTQEEEQLAEEIIGNIDEDGYLRRELQLIVQDLNLSHGLSISPERAERVLLKIQRLDPPGIAARTLQECLIAQLEVGEFHNGLKDRALKLVREQWEEFTLKHYNDLAQNLSITRDELKHVIELIQKLNPKPGEGTLIAQQNYIVPDFIVERDNDDFVIQLNDRNVPALRVNKKYKELITRKRNNGTPAEVKTFIRDQFERAKWFISCIYQRRETMMKVMRAIVEKQRDFFDTGENLKPMIYKIIAEIIGMDISTISRVVNGKYVQTEFGVFELRYFFSDKLTTTSGDEISNKEVKKHIKQIIDNENPDKPLADESIAEMLKQEGLNIARRTVAKYREAMAIPVARLRRKL